MSGKKIFPISIFVLMHTYKHINSLSSSHSLSKGSKMFKKCGHSKPAMYCKAMICKNVTIYQRKPALPKLPTNKFWSKREGNSTSHFFNFRKKTRGMTNCSSHRLIQLRGGFFNNSFFSQTSFNMPDHNKSNY